MKKRKILSILLVGLTVIAVYLFSDISFLESSSTDNCVKGNSEWNIDFFDDFDSFNSDNWQDQRIWVNNEKQCYVPDNQYGTREVSEGTLKIKVINIGEKIECDNMDKHGNQHPETSYIARRIASKNRKEFVKGKWTARLRIQEKAKHLCFLPGGFWVLKITNRLFKNPMKIFVGRLLALVKLTYLNIMEIMVVDITQLEQLKV